MSERAKPIVVGTTSVGYNEERNFLSLPTERYTFRRRYDLFTVPRAIIYRTRHYVHPFFQNAHLDLGINGCRLLHFFNKVSFSRTPWITTFETAVPRWNSGSRRGLRALASPHCRAVIAMSHRAAAIQRRSLERHPAFRDEIARKMLVRHPAQRALVARYEDKPVPSDRMVFTIVGGDFFRKGGAEVLVAFEHLVRSGRAAELRIVSSLAFGDYASHATADERDTAIRIIERNPTSIRWYRSLPNAEVLQLLRESHVGLLPTLADTFGYSVLEAQAAGCAVVTSNVRALPEINDERSGWIVPLEIDEDGNAHNVSDASRRRMRRQLAEQLSELLVTIVDSPDDVRRRGSAALDRIVLHHDPSTAAAALERIYDAALAD